MLGVSVVRMFSPGIALFGSAKAVAEILALGVTLGVAEVAIGAVIVTTLLEEVAVYPTVVQFPTSVNVQALIPSAIACAIPVEVLGRANVGPVVDGEMDNEPVFENTGAYRTLLAMS
jgi:hypothetical protein